jgi:hypothetical protein
MNRRSNAPSPIHHGTDSAAESSAALFCFEIPAWRHPGKFGAANAKYMPGLDERRALLPRPPAKHKLKSKTLGKADPAPRTPRSWKGQ